jgi:hypothetical protein
VLIREIRGQIFWDGGSGMSHRAGIIFARGKIIMEKHGAGALSILLLPANVRAFSCHLPHSAATGRAL